MNMNTDIYDKVRALAVELINASSVDDTKSRWRLYNELSQLCMEFESGESDHPFQWEALADFTLDDAASIGIYEKAFVLAKDKQLVEYMGSIKFALAVRYSELHLSEQAYESAKEANEYVKSTNDMVLRQEISQFLLDESQRI